MRRLLIVSTTLASLALPLSAVAAPHPAGPPDKPKVGKSLSHQNGRVALKAVEKKETRKRAGTSVIQPRSSLKSGSGSTSKFSESTVETYRIASYEQHLIVLERPIDCPTATCIPLLTVAPNPDMQPDPGVAAPTMTAAEAAYIAVARLNLDPPKPIIGPSPEINEWNIAAVGYPYWLWAEGNLDPAPVSTTVADLTVTLDAHLASTTFDLGDGTRMTCTDLSARWSRAVEPGAPSPTCGHTYTKPSLPGGKYTITAYSTWAVDWSVNGVGGTIPLNQQASTTVPVGELQVLTH